MADLSHKDVVAAFEARYDHQSARNVLAEALKSTGLGEKDAYPAGDIKKVTEALAASGERFVDIVVTALAGDSGGDGAPAPAKEAKKEEKQEGKKDEKKDEKKETKKKKK